MTPRQIIDNAAALMLEHTRINLGITHALVKGRGAENGIKWVLLVIPEFRNKAIKVEIAPGGKCIISSGQVLTTIISDKFDQDTPIDQILTEDVWLK